MQKIDPSSPARQGHRDDDQSLSSTDRNLLLRATLGLFLRRLNHNIPVFRDDLLRLAYYADDAPEQRA
jgi:hypothetical protein